LSARIDGEEVAGFEPAVEQHLAGCAACQSWLRQAEGISRQARIAPAPDLGPLLDSVLGAVQTATDRRRRAWLSIRVAICLVALAQLAITIPVLVLGHDRDAPLHVSHEMGSWDAALAIGLLLAVRRPSRAEGMSVLIGIGSLLLVTTAFIDLVAGRTTLSDEAPHLLCVAGWLLLHRLAGLHAADQPGPAGAAIAGPAENSYHRAA
jgi:predicted anti-sigma-YlaC factor YlaD